MSVSRKLTIRPETVENVYDYYNSRNLLVNRRYQRKLVWTIEEKSEFIDSLSQGFPVPLILVSETVFKGEEKFEIIDGMQRLDAITAFIEGKVPLNGKYFDLDAIASTKYLKDNGKIKQQLPKLDREVCKDIATYPLPLSVSHMAEDERIDETFRRINSNGRHLSKQELRQVGSESKFGELVKQISETIRGDVSHSDRLYLNEMKKISINNRDLNYGINMGGIFWRKHNIITSKNIRESRDEELVAYLLSAILINPRPSATANNLDKFYGYSDPGDGHPAIEHKISQLGFDFIKEQFEAVFGEVRHTLEATRSSFMKLLFRRETKYTSRSFQVLFLAFHDLIIKERKKVIDYKRLANALRGVGDDYLTPNAISFNQSSSRENAINALKGLIREYFTDRDSNDPILSNGVVRLESLLSRSKTENTNYDFKIGFHKLNGVGEFDSACFSKVLRTLTAMANSGKKSRGYVVIGIADTERDAERFSSFHNSQTIKFKNFNVCGIDGEVSKYRNIEEYRTKIEQKINNSDIAPEYYKNYILRHMDMFTYYDKSIIIFEIEAGDEPAEFEGEIYERQGTSTKLIPSNQKKQIWKKFL